MGGLKSNTLGVLLALVALSIGLTTGYRYGKDETAKAATEFLNKTFRCIGLDVIGEELQCTLLKRRWDAPTPSPPP